MPIKGTERIREVEYQRLFDLNASIIEGQVFGGEWDWQQNKKKLSLDSFILQRVQRSESGKQVWLK